MAAETDSKEGAAGPGGSLVEMHCAPLLDVETCPSLILPHLIFLPLQLCCRNVFFPLCLP